MNVGPEAASAAPGLRVAAVEAAARRAGLLPGDRIVRLAGATPVDVLDLEDAAADGPLHLTVVRADKALEIVVAPGADEWHGISLGWDGIGAKTRVCRNRCRFCFVDQVPAGLRPGLYVKDDDYRLSFLHGNFMTLTNLSEGDMTRIERLRLTPLFVSLHAWDDDARVGLMGEAARGSRRRLERLAADGLELHLQVVLCPGWNDGQVLRETIERCEGLPAVADLGVVPVSLATEGELRRVRRRDAEDALAVIEERQAACQAGRGAAFVHAADELYLACGRMPPTSDAPEQYENGIGMASALLLDAARPCGYEGAAATCRADVADVRLLCGTLALPVLDEVAAELEGRWGVAVRAFPVENRLFGAHVTVTGLLGGGEVLDALRREPLCRDEWLVAPRVFLPEALGRTLDDVDEGEIAAACGGRLVVADSLTDAFARLSR